MRKNYLPQWIVEREFRKATGNPAAAVEYLLAPIRGATAIKFSVKTASLTIQVGDEDLKGSVAHFSEKFIRRVCELFREANVPGVNPGPMSTSGLSLGAARGENHA